MVAILGFVGAAASVDCHLRVDRCCAREVAVGRVHADEDFAWGGRTISMQLRTCITSRGSGGFCSMPSTEAVESFDALLFIAGSGVHYRYSASWREIPGPT